MKGNALVTALLVFILILAIAFLLAIVFTGKILSVQHFTDLFEAIKNMIGG